MEVKVNNKVRRIWNRKEWTPEMDAVVLRMADGETTIGEIAVAVTQETGTSVSKPLTRKRMIELGCPMRMQGGKIIVTQEMRDFIYAKAMSGKTIAEIQAEFNEWFDVDWNTTRIYRVMLSVNADRSQRIAKAQFIEDWTRLQAKFAPNGEICRKNWLWRWRRLDENRTASGMVFHGKRVDIPDLKGGVPTTSVS